MYKPSSLSVEFERVKALLAVFLRALIIKSPWYLVRFGCVVAFIMQTTTLIADMINPKETLIKTQIMDFDKIDFPLAFKICITPGFNTTELRALGYENIAAYFTGGSRFNGSIIGWAGHTADGKVASNVSGNHSRHHLLKVITICNFRCDVKGNDQPMDLSEKYRV